MISDKGPLRYDGDTDYTLVSEYEDASFWVTIDDKYEILVTRYASEVFGRGVVVEIIDRAVRREDALCDALSVAEACENHE